ECLAGLLMEVNKLRGERIGDGFTGSRDIVGLRRIGEAIVELTFRRLHIQVLPRAQSTQRAPAKCPMGILSLGVRNPGFRYRLRSRCTRLEHRFERLALHLLGKCYARFAK